MRNTVKTGKHKEKYKSTYTNSYVLIWCMTDQCLFHIAVPPDSTSNVDSFHRGLRYQFQQFICSMELKLYFFENELTFLLLFIFIYLELNLPFL